MLNAVKFDYFKRPRNLRYDINAIADIEREMKTGILSILSEERLGLDSIRVFLWAGLKHEDQSITVIKVGNWIQTYIEESKKSFVDVMSEFTDIILEALKLSGIIPKKDDDQGNEQNGVVTENQN